MTAPGNDRGYAGAPHRAMEGGAPSGVTAAPIGDLPGSTVAKKGRGRGNGGGRGSAPSIEGVGTSDVAPIDGAPAIGRGRGRGRTAAKPAAKARARHATRADFPDSMLGINLGCSKCVYKPLGCSKCRVSAGLVMDEASRTWSIKPL
jgi:hypothetical protein